MSPYQTFCRRGAWSLGVLLSLLVSLLELRGDVVLEADFTKEESALGVVYDFWDVHNRLPPFESINVPSLGKKGAKINCVRLLGGWRSMDTSVDAYKWDGEAYVYDWEVLKRRIDVVLASGMELYQFVLDNPPWAFQRGLTFVDEPDGIHYLKKDMNATYGNPVPPNDPEAWARFIEEMMRELVRSYGRETVAGWRFRVGSEIDTRPGHWVGTMEQFFEHYRITSNAVWSVVPEAKVGVQFREATMENNYIDYTGKNEGSYGAPFIEWAKANGIHYDFIGVSFYPIYTREDEVDLEQAYALDFAVMNDHPDRLAGSSFEIHEYAAMAQIQKGNFVWLSNSYEAAFFVNLACLVYDKNIAKVHQWRKSSFEDKIYSPEVLAKAALDTMVGKQRFAVSRLGEPEVKGNMIDGIFARGEGEALDALIFNYNANPQYRDDESLLIRMKTQLPVGASFRYRIATYSAEECAFQRFAADYPKALAQESDGGWVRDGISSNGQPAKSLNEEGYRFFESVADDYTQYNELQWGEWRSGVTFAAPGEGPGSEIILGVGLPSFSFRKIEVRP